MKVDQPHLRRLLERGDHAGFVEQLEPLCNREVRRTALNGVEYEDAMQEARYAVCRAAQKWEPAGGANPLTLATLFIRNHLWKVAKEQLAHKRSANLTALSLDASGSGDPDGAPLGNIVPSREPCPDDVVEQRALVEEMRRFVERLPYKERAVGENMLQEEPRTMRELAVYMDVSTARVQQIDAQVRRRIRRAVAA